MDMPVNFLPWRQTRRKATLRLWSMMFGGALVLISGVTLSRDAIGNIETRAEGVLLLAEQQLASALQASKPRLLQRQQMHQQAKRRQQELAATGNWQPALYALAEQLPEKAWFTKMAWQKDRLMLSGLAANIASLTALEQMLRSNASFLLIHTGATQQDAKGRWQFEYQLQRRDDNEHVL
ncbi:DNA utilization protein HofN [Escherichia fergusonii]|uniref:PilN domain-containing protein n=1 Tax=Escherichia fergusonii TaxID=564 RepID=UPI000F67D8B8|nr:PilN domain-containing protein [Escherichia fergusonii]QCZ30717.1 DNA utilization protein HofN [Escherichia fergusonii]